MKVLERIPFSLVLKGPDRLPFADMFKEFTSGLPWGVQWLRLHAPNAGVVGLIPGRGAEIPHAAQGCQNKKTSI